MNARMIPVIIACVALVLTAGAPRAPEVWAQDARLEGAYEAKEYAVNDEAKPALLKGMSRLYLLPNRNYIWMGYHAPYRVNGQVIELDCRWSGEVFVTTSRRLVFSWIKRELRQEHKVTLEFLGPVDRYPPDEQPILKPCGWKQAGSSSGPLVAVGPQRQPAQANLQAQATPRRAIDGELLLTVRNQGATEADFRLWNCLTTGYPKVELVEPGQPARQVFVWPDARFRAELRGGVPYQWWLLPEGCDTATRQQGGLIPPGPVNPVPTEEKVVLACYASAGRLADCHAWWLIKP